MCIIIDKNTPIKNLQDFVDSDNDSYSSLVFEIFANYNLHLNPSNKVYQDNLKHDLSYHGISYVDDLTIIVQSDASRKETTELRRNYKMEYSIFAESDNGTENVDFANSEGEAQEIVNSLTKKLKDGVFKNDTSLENIQSFNYDQLG
jgi:hypothetical protein